MDKAIGILQYLRKRLHFLDGLIVLLLASECVYIAAVKAVGRECVLLLQALGCLQALSWCRAIYLLGFLLVPSIAFIIWRRIRTIPRCSKKELAILFAPNAEPNTQEVIDRLVVNLKQEIKSKEFGVRFSLRPLPPNLSIDSAEEAIGLLRDSRAVVAVWGPVEQQQSDQGKTTGFSKLSVTFIHRPTRIHPLRQEALAMSLVERQLHVRERTQIADQRIVAKDIGIVVRNVLGVALLIDRRHTEAVKILGPLHIDLEAVFPEKTSPPVQRFRMQVQYDFAYALTMSTADEYRKWLAEGKIHEIPKSVLEGWIKSVKHASRLDPQNSIHPLSEAIYLFLLGDVRGAIEAEKKADHLSPRAAAIANLGLAFLYNFSGDLKRSRDQYRLGLAKKTSYEEEMVNQCVAFISQSIKRFPEKKQLLLALSVLQYHRGSRTEAKRTLEQLLEDPPTEPQLQGFVEEAKRLQRQIDISTAERPSGSDLYNVL